MLHTLFLFVSGPTWFKFQNIFWKHVFINWIHKTDKSYFFGSLAYNLNVVKLNISVVSIPVWLSVIALLYELWRTAFIQNSLLLCIFFLYCADRFKIKIKIFTFLKRFNVLPYQSIRHKIEIVWVKWKCFNIIIKLN